MKAGTIYHMDSACLIIMSCHFPMLFLELQHSSIIPRNACVACQTKICVTTKKVWLPDRQTDRHMDRQTLDKVIPMLRRQHNQLSVITYNKSGERQHHVNKTVWKTQRIWPWTCQVTLTLNATLNFYRCWTDLCVIITNVYYQFEVWLSNRLILVKKQLSDTNIYRTL